MTLFGNTSSSSSSNNTNNRVPPGFRFHPTDEELVGYYLRKKVDSKKIDLDVIHEIDLYKLEPWDLQERCKIGSAEQTEWYFFSHKDKKYPTGTRTNRATAAGFWKATGRDKAIHAKYKLIGMRKTLVFYKGRAPNGQKSDWIMHEYRLEDDHPNNSNSSNNNDDGWVVCRVFKKRSSHKPMDRDMSCCYDDQIALLPELESPSKFDLPYHHQQQHHHHHHHQQQHLVNCKQEFGLEPPPFFDPFAQLPRLESPRLAPSSSHAGLLKGFLSHHHAMRDFALEPASSSFDGDHHRPPFQQPVTDWRMVDRLAAAQLSHEVQASSSKEGFQDGTSSDLPSAEDVELLCRLSKQQQANSSEGDLWSFGR